MKLVSVYDVMDTSPEPIRVLYQLLGERPAQNFIAHSRMPAFEEHERFVRGRPFLHWLLIEHDGAYIGAIEALPTNEFGIAILKQAQGRGFGAEALRLFFSQIKPQPAITAVRHGRWLANVSPNNQRGRRFFEKFGFVKIQETYAL